MVCTTIELLNILGKKWNAVILESIYDEKDINFDKLLSINPKIYPKTLNKALKDLLKAELITKEISIQNNIKHSRYALTQKGDNILKQFTEFKRINCTDPSGDSKRCGKCERGPNQVVTPPVSEHIN